MNITYTNSISAEDYNALRHSVGWQEVEYSQAKTGLKNTAFLIVAKDGEKSVGITRFISDGGYIGFLADVIVLPEYQGKGIGRVLLERTMSYIKSSLKSGQTIMVSLMASKGKEAFYNKFGFSDRPNEDFGCGMHLWVNG